jgi:hypothetical protein
VTTAAAWIGVVHAVLTFLGGYGYALTSDGVPAGTRAWEKAGYPVLLIALAVVLAIGAGLAFGGSPGLLTGAAVASLVVSAWFIVRSRSLGEHADAIPLLYAVAPVAILLLGTR